MKKVNVAELLKDCPIGMELDSPMYDNLYFNSLNADSYGTINCYTLNYGVKTSIDFTKYGTFNNHIGAKCVIFPKGKTTWEGFIPPYTFKDGDVVVNALNKDSNAFIYAGENDDYYNSYVGLMRGANPELSTNKSDNWVSKTSGIRFATEEEKEKLFQAIKDNGYKWNAETKTLDKLIEPSFKVGDKVRHKNNHSVVFTITSIEEDSYVCGTKAAFWFDDQDKYELVPDKFDVSTLKPFDKVLVRDTDKGCWDITFYELYTENYPYPHRTLEGNVYKQCIPYEGNEHLMGLVKDCDDYYKTWNN